MCFFFSESDLELVFVLRRQQEMSEENTEELKMLELQVQRLQAEVEALEQQKEESYKDMMFHSGGQIRDAM